MTLDDEKKFIRYTIQSLEKPIELLIDYIDGDSEVDPDFPNINKREARRLVKHIRRALAEALYLEFKLKNIKG